MSEENTNETNDSKKSETITIKRDTLWKVGVFVLAALLVLSVVTGGFGGPTGQAAQTTQDPSQQQPSQVEASVDDDAVLGDPNAPVTMIEFSDYQCPFCRKFWTETFDQIKEEYIDTGKVQYVFRDFTPTLVNPQYHPMAVKAAMAAECVAEQGGDEAYFEMHDKIFEEQNIMDSGNPRGQVTATMTFTDADLKSWAQDLGYDIASCLDSEEMMSEVEKDFSDGRAAGIQGTPGFVINGVPVSGAQPFAAFQQVIESEL